MSTECIKNEMNPDQHLISFLSTKLTDVYASWIQSNHTDLFSNYQALFTAYNQLKVDHNKRKEENTLKGEQIKILTLQMETTESLYQSETKQMKADYDRLKEENTLKGEQITRLKSQIKSTESLHQSPPKQTPNNTNIMEEKTEYNNEMIKKLKNEIKSLENNLNSTKNRLKSAIKETSEYQLEIRNLKQQNKDLQFKADLNAKCIENETNLKQMNHEQTKERYNELKEHHTNNMKSIHSFLNQINNRYGIFLNKYSKNENQIIMINTNNESTNHGLTSNIEPKLTTTYANLEQFLHNVSMLMLKKESEGLNNSVLSDIDITMSGDET